MFKCRARVYVNVILVETSGDTAEKAREGAENIVEWLTMGELDKSSLISVVVSGEPSDVITWEEK